MPPGKARTFEAGRDIDAVAINAAVALLDHVTQVHANAESACAGLQARHPATTRSRAATSSAASTAPDAAVSNTASTESPAMSMTRPWLASMRPRNSAARCVERLHRGALRRPPSGASSLTASAARMAASRCLSSVLLARIVPSRGRSQPGPYYRGDPLARRRRRARIDREHHVAGRTRSRWASRT